MTGAAYLLIWRLFVHPLVESIDVARKANTSAGRAAAYAALPVLYVFYFAFRPRRGDRLNLAPSNCPRSR